VRTLSLRGKIITTFTAIITIVLIGEGWMLWYTNRIETMFGSMVDKEFLLYRTAQDMEIALANQKGLLTYYLVDGNGKWLKALGEQRQLFNHYLERTSSIDLNAWQRQQLLFIAEKFKEYAEAKDRAIDNYQGNTLHGSVSTLHESQREIFLDLLEECRLFSNKQWQAIVDIENGGRRLTEKLRIVLTIGIMVFALCCGMLLFILYRSILGPIRGLAIKTGVSRLESTHDEVGSLVHGLKGMMRDFDQTTDELAKSRRHLLQVERLAMVGELAAGVAHTIRNPFTSIKMRMFSLSRSLDLNAVQNEDLQVISEEINRIDRIVENFLDFARTPKLRMELCLLDDIIQDVLILLEYRIKTYNVDIVYNGNRQFPPLLVDADRIKEALVNLITNACEAMEGGGRIIISESRSSDTDLGEIAVITIEDTGQGIPAEILDKVVAPFFTTKEEGSGLGLSIVARIAREHRGRFVIKSAPLKGAVCILELPVKLS
jgi:signal transduction histidine kinase